MRIHVAASELYTYPDASVVCGEPRFLGDRTDTLLNPTLIVEVLSPSTESYDRGRKFEHYRSIESVAEYLLISADRMNAESYARQADGRWLLTAVSQPAGSLELQSIGVRLTLADLYDKVDLTQAAG
jgi:Uma2 family endonuclease